MEKKYVIVEWPDIQEYMERHDFREEAYPILCENGVDKYGSSAYFVPEEWILPIEDAKSLRREEEEGDFFKEISIF